MVAKTQKAVPSSPEGLGEEATTSWGIEKIAAILIRAWEWMRRNKDKKCPMFPSRQSNGCTGCQDLEEKHGMNAPYFDSEFNMPPHSPQVRSMRKKLEDLMNNKFKQWEVLDLQETEEYTTLTRSR